MIKIISLKVQRYSAGKKFPFDRVYIFRTKDLAEAKKITPVNLTFPLRGEIKERLEALYIDRVASTREGRRYEQPVPSGHTLKARSEGSRRRDTCVLPFADSKGESPLMRELVAELPQPNFTGWSILIPILNTSWKKPNGSSPYYLVNKYWAPRSDKMAVKNDPDTHLTVASGTPIIPDSACLKVLDEEITPPCRACPRLLEHMHGDCQIGGKVCLSEMSFSRPSYFTESLLEGGKVREHSVKEISSWLRGSEEGLDNN